MSRKKWPLFEEQEVVDLDVKARGIIRSAKGVVFVPDVLPGDVVDVQVLGKRKGVLNGISTKLHKRSERYKVPFCQHFDDCGGCKLQHYQYEYQLAYKQKLVDDAFTRIAKITPLAQAPILPCLSTEYYRNKLDFAFSASRWITKSEAAVEKAVDQRNALGFHVAGRFDKILHVSECHLQPEPSNAIRNFVYDYCIDHNLPFYDIKARQGYMRSLILRDNGDGVFMVMIMVAEHDTAPMKALANSLNETFLEVQSIYGMVNTKGNDSYQDLEMELLSGQAELTFTIGDLQYAMGPKSFMQTNSQQTLRLYNLVAEKAGLTGNEVVYDLFCGVGTIGMHLAQNAKQIIGIEMVEEAIVKARENAERNQLSNVAFYAGNAEDVLNDAFVAAHPAPDVIITDPPRAGMHPKVVEMIRQMAAPKWLYVSCNPSTQARDIAMLEDTYQLDFLQAVDMFPHTPHVESVAVLSLKNTQSSIS